MLADVQRWSDERGLCPVAVQPSSGASSISLASDRNPGRATRPRATGPGGQLLLLTPVLVLVEESVCLLRGWRERRSLCPPWAGLQDEAAGNRPERLIP